MSTVSTANHEVIGYSSCTGTQVTEYPFHYPVRLQIQWPFCLVDVGIQYSAKSSKLLIYYPFKYLVLKNPKIPNTDWLLSKHHHWHHHHHHYYHYYHPKEVQSTYY